MAFHHRRDVIRGLGAAGIVWLAGPGCSLSSGKSPPGNTSLDAGASGPDGAAARDLVASGDAFVGLPPIDLKAPKVTQTATFALG